MSTLVMKFGGAAVATPECFAAIADVIIDRSRDHHRVAVVVSAMGDTTDELLSLAKRVNSNPPMREMDMLISAGERISIALLAMALEAKGKRALSFTGSQTGIITSTDHSDASIIDVRPQRLLPHLDAGEIVVVAGFQGVSTAKEITTLGRGGSDKSAVALGIALDAAKVEFFKDVKGIFDSDPNENPNAKLYAELTYDEAAAIVQKGHQVLQLPSILLAQKNNLPLNVLPFRGYREPHSGTWIGPKQRLFGSQPIYETHRRLPISS